MDYGALIKFVCQRFGRVASVATYYNYIADWLTWYKGFDPTFHTIITSNGLTVPKREMYQLRMGERVARDWASTVCSEPPTIVVSSNTDKPSIFVQGSKNNTGVLGSNNFNELLSMSLEQMFALGTSAIVVNLDDVACDAQGNIVDASRGRIGFSVFNATRVIPISSVNNVIKECAFVTEMQHKGQAYFVVSAHVLEEDGYVIYNYVLNNRYNSSSLPFGTLPIIRTKSMKPLFYILKPNIVNNVDMDSPLGVSVYANAIDNLKSVDQAFDACIRDVVTGQRIILMNKCLLTTDESGKPVVPQDVKQTYMQFFGDEAGADVSEYIKEFTPKLNSEELDRELQNQLNMLSFKCGLGTHYYNFDRSGGLTATEYAGERQDFVRNVRRMNVGIADSIASIVRVVLELGANVLKNGVDSSAKVDVTMPDGIVEDDTKEREQDRQDVKDGIMSKAEYRAKWYGETIEEAELHIAAIVPTADNTV